MQRGEVWWVKFDERRLVVLLAADDASRIRAMQVVTPAGVDISGLGVEVQVGAMEGLPFEGVLRFAFPSPGFTLHVADHRVPGRPDRTGGRPVLREAQRD